MNDDFSRYELLVIHRLDHLEKEAKLAHTAVEDLRLDVVTLRRDVEEVGRRKAAEAKAHATRVAFVISLIGAALPQLIRHFLP